MMNYWMSSGQSQSAAKETNSLIAASSVNGTDVYNVSGDCLGSIHDVMLDKCSGQVKYAVMSFGGFRAMGAKFHTIPWDQLSFSEQYDGYVINLDRSWLHPDSLDLAARTPDWSSAPYPRSLDEYLSYAERR